MKSILLLGILIVASNTFAAEIDLVNQAREMFRNTGVDFSAVSNLKWSQDDCVGTYIGGDGMVSDSSGTRITGSIEWKNFPEHMAFEVKPMIQQYYKNVDSPNLPYNGGYPPSMFKKSESILWSTNGEFSLIIKANDSNTIAVEASMSKKAQFADQLSQYSGLAAVDPQNFVPYAYFICKH
jgi:hypothetical protein